MFASTILVLEAFTIFFGTLAVFGLHFNDPSTVKIIIWVAGLVLAGACIFLPAKLAKPWGYSAGWVLQGAMLLASSHCVTLLARGNNPVCCLLVVCATRPVPDRRRKRKYAPPNKKNGSVKTYMRVSKQRYRRLRYDRGQHQDIGIKIPVFMTRKLNPRRRTR